MIELVRPADGHETQWFGNIQPDGKRHAGQDYAYYSNGKVCDAVYAAADGIVLFAGDSRNLGWPNVMYLNPDFDRTDAQDSSAGNYIILQHHKGGAPVALTGYGHLAAYTVKAGQKVKAGQRIGTIGETGYSFGKHLHFDLMFYPLNYNTPTYGKSDPNPYFPGSLSLASESITHIPEDDVSAEDVFTKKLILKNGAESTFENQVLNISDDLSKVLKRLEEDRDYAEKVNGKIDALFNLLSSLPADIMDKPITTTDGKATTLANELKWLPANFAAAQDVK